MWWNGQIIELNNMQFVLKLLGQVYISSVVKVDVALDKADALIAKVVSNLGVELESACGNGFALMWVQ